MDVKGTAYLARRAMLVGEFGEERFAAFMKRVGEREPAFAVPVLATSSVPIRAFLKLNEAIVREFYGGDTDSLWKFGEKSADWALTEGPYKHLLASKSIPEFAESASRIYKNYYTRGSAVGTVGDGEVTLAIVGVPQEFRHIYFEYSIVGYFRRGLELLGAHELTSTRERGFSHGDDEIRYRFSYRV